MASGNSFLMESTATVPRSTERDPRFHFISTTSIIVRSSQTYNFSKAPQNLSLENFEHFPSKAPGKVTLASGKSFLIESTAAVPRSTERDPRYTWHPSSDANCKNVRGVTAFSYERGTPVACTKGSLTGSSTLPYTGPCSGYAAAE